MSWRQEQQDMVWDGVEMGIAPSPTKGTANIQNANISTESGEVLASYGRVAQTPQAITNGTLTPDGATNFTGPANLQAGQWISVSASTVTSINTTTSPATNSVDYLVVGGGGGGGGAANGGGGGGGAGEVATGSSNVSVQAYSITVGDGGDGGTTGNGSNGESSAFGSIDTAIGGGGGALDGNNGSNGASGGGGGGDSTTSGTGGTGTAGNNGGNGFANATLDNRAGGGGGGSGAAGSNGSSGTGGAGGNGTSSSLTGTATVYGAGGGGGAANGAGGEGGNAGLGGAGNGGTNSAGTSASSNRGGGGGGAGDSAGSSARAGGNGGSGIVVISYNLGSMVAVGGDVYTNGTKVVHVFRESGVFNVLSITQTNLYYVSYKSGTTYKLSAKFDPTGANALTHGTTGSVTFSTVAVPNKVIAKATEKYTNANTVEYRYYVLDTNSYLWVFDSFIYETYGTQWMLPDPSSYSALRLTGLGVLNGLVMAVGKAFVVAKPNNDLGRIFLALGDVFLNEPFPTHNNFALVGNQGKMYYCDGNYIGEIFPTTSLVTSIANIQSHCTYTASTTTGTITSIVSGSLPYSPDGTRIPAIFYTDVYGTQPTNLTTFTVYYIECNPTNASFQVFSTASGDSAINIATGAAGNQFFTTFWPYGQGGVDGAKPLVQVSTQRVNLPANEVAQCMVEVGNTVLIGGVTNIVYPWNQVDATPSDFIYLPESNVKTMINVNNMAYIFAGNKGNVYISNSSVASLAIKVPDYCAGVPGTPLTYIEPYFTWGDATYIRGRVYFSILDQTATKAGNCGGVWSFIPPQNIDPSQEVGMALRLENQNSYGDYDGYATILIPNEEQNAVSPQYWSFWQDSYSTGTSTFGIDYTNTVPVTKYVIETDLAPTGTMLRKETFSQLEYKLTTALASGDSVQIYWRLNSTDAWASAGTVRTEANNLIAGYFDQNFQKTQWVQFRIEVTLNGTTTSSFGRLKQVRLR